MESLITHVPGKLNCPASVAQRQSVGLGIESSRVRNSPVSSGFSLRQGNESALLGIAQFAGNAHWTEPSPLFAPRFRWMARPTSLNSKDEYQVFAHQVRKLQPRQMSALSSRRSADPNPRSRKQSARSNGLITYASNFFFPFSIRGIAGGAGQCFHVRENRK